ncbi:Alpha/beta hydrolase [Leptospira biflexa serovar Patoc strain 'Patoc 1 (Ames)']|uniref:Putative triacylglycerol lipase putative signal peptide n=1 Tax=Leptospira biflexa serovar Patoc (strain Patoc 1 / ATCC 23582 / Paris) TaxID=456481 RepID=B0SPZ3_LEPBP|nr:alpha/beta hydrolase [Leptospira biflexa]ABZ93915.1 Alpha/beta hydrolase [Leptospira biflexa serovar Patoc strain 'Patoc 1 (Ames)']ABZ97559.1 Putative triacylglycerol lipase; putative signal peptide [Leptospira biflexa serovar Patoc strain 'Patoc 1 (Paris)']
MKSKLKLHLSLIIITGTLFGCASQLHKTGISIERYRSDLETKSVVVEDLDWKYTEKPGDGETLLVVHGFGGDKDHWTRFSRHLPKNIRVIAPDLPGFGESSKPEGISYTQESQAIRLQKFTEKLGLTEFHIAGNSMGGGIAGLFASKFPKQVKTLILFDNAGIKSPVPSEMQTIELSGKESPLLVKDTEDFDRLLRFTFVKPPYLPSFLKSYFAEKSVANREWNAHILKQIRKEGYVLESQLDQIKAPCLTIWGKEDKVIHYSVMDVLKAKLKSKLETVLLENMGHAPMIEDPKLSAKLVQDWILNGSVNKD